MKAIALVMIIVLCLGYSLCAQNNPFGITNTAWAELMFVSSQRQHEREIAQREFDARMALKRRADRVETLYKDIAVLFNTLNVAQVRQFQLESEGEVSIRQDVLVSRLTGELKNKVDDLNKINHVK